jgi:C1A family cysteine protease
MKLVCRQLILLALSCAFHQGFASSGDRPINSDYINKINEAIKTRGAKWVAGENWVTRLPDKERKKLYGAVSEIPDISKARKLNYPRPQNLPPHFDWRDNQGKWVTPIKCQGGSCGDCWAFACIAQIESWWMIHNSRPDSMIDLSEQSLISCADIGGCNGSYPSLALEYARTAGVPSERCFAYMGTGYLPSCSTACTSWQDEAVRIPDWGFVTLDEPDVESLKNAIYHYPLTTHFWIYEDLNAYKSGVYEHVSGSFTGSGHVVLLIGWDNSDQCWICKNSWGDQWGEEGYFRIKWGECGIGRYSPGIRYLLPGSEISVSAESINVSCILGDSISNNITLENRGNRTIDYSAVDYQAESEFHPDEFNSWDSRSWWCGDPTIGGYGDRWLQYLDSPVLDLSRTSKPSLSFMANWSLPCSGAGTFDGGDGCNVWVSTNGGQTFRVAWPVTPKYQSQNLMSFSDSTFSCGWNIGPQIPGWSCTSGGWIPAEFDLSAFKSDSTVIRFAFGSDCLQSTQDYDFLTGFFVDEIRVADGGNVIFFSNGERMDMNPSLERNLPPGYDFPLNADWMSITEGSGIIEPGDSSNVEVLFSTGHLDAGLHHGGIRISSSDPSQPSLDIPCRLEVLRPEHDLSIGKKAPVGSNLPMFLFNRICAVLVNRGASDENDIGVFYALSEQGQIVKSDTVVVSCLQSGESTLIEFEPVFFDRKHEFKFDLGIADTGFLDHSPQNNSNQTSLSVSNLLDDFEGETGFWDTGNAWQIRNYMSAHSGLSCIFSLNGENAVLTLKRPLSLPSGSAAVLKFWTKYSSTRDIMYVETSQDSATWMKLDSLKGKTNEWVQKAVDLSAVMRIAKEMWVRFNIVSQGTVARHLFRIDDIEIDTDQTDVNIVEEYQDCPLKCALTQNYPNPFNSSTTIRFDISRKQHVALRVFDMLGREIVALKDEDMQAGVHSVVFDAANLTSGVYFIRMTVGEKNAIQKIVVLK